MSKVLVLDTSVLCVWLQISGKDTMGKANDPWDFKRVNHKIEEEIAKRTVLVLPLASIIETGNHIAQCPGDRFTLAGKFADLIRKTANNETPWAAFTVQSDLWSAEKLNALADNWPILAASKLSLGDATIKDVAEYYAEQGLTVEIFTGDQGLKAYEPKPTTIPRRRK
jgi:hypothetical protein